MNLRVSLETHRTLHFLTQISRQQFCLPGFLGGTVFHFRAAWFRGSGGARKQGWEDNYPENTIRTFRREGRSSRVNEWRPEEGQGETGLPESTGSHVHHAAVKGI